MDSKTELARLFDLEYGDLPELIVRFAGVFGGSWLLFAYSGWTTALFWGGGFAAAHLAYFGFLRTRLRAEAAQIGKRDVKIATGLFLLVLISFLWLPATLIVQPDKALTVVGAALMGCILVFLVRRSDTGRCMILGEIAVVACIIAGVIAHLFPQLDGFLPRMGVVVAALALLGYFARALQVSRRQRLTAEEATRRSAQAQKMAAVGQLAGGVAHDFNNKLTAILGSLELLQEIDDPAERAAITASAREAALAAARTVKHLMVYARKERMQPQVLECDALLDAVLSHSRATIPSNVRLDLHGTGQALSVLADRNQMMLGLTNLVANAIDAMPGGGTLTLGVQPVAPGAHVALADGTTLEARGHVALTVSDTGGGIPPELLPKVVEPFFTTKSLVQASGLGLPAVVGMARELGGGLGIATSPEGTRATIYLPSGSDR